MLEGHVGDGQLNQAVGCLASIDGLAVNEEERSIGIPVGADAAVSLELLQRLQTSGISITDFQLRRPTLDDVFLTLTGATTHEELPA